MDSSRFFCALSLSRELLALEKVFDDDDVNDDDALFRRPKVARANLKFFFLTNRHPKRERERKELDLLCPSDIHAMHASWQNKTPPPPPPQSREEEARVPSRFFFFLFFSSMSFFDTSKHLERECVTFEHPKSEREIPGLDWKRERERERVRRIRGRCSEAF